MRSRGRILIVDDEANARAALSEILREEGYVTETAADGFKALGKLEEFGPDVVLTDLKMPGLDGIAFMEKARAASPDTVFVVMTAFGTISSAVAAIKEGAENYLAKPLDYDAAALRAELQTGGALLPADALIVAQQVGSDGEGPGLEAGTALESVELVHYLEVGVLRQVLCAAQVGCEAVEVGNQLWSEVDEFLCVVIFVHSLSPSSHQ